MNLSVIIQAVRQHGTKTRIPSLLFLLFHKQHIVLLRNTDILSCQVLSNVVLVEPCHQKMPVSPAEENVGQSHYWHKWAQLQ